MGRACKTVVMAAVMCFALLSYNARAEAPPGPPPIGGSCKVCQVTIVQLPGDGGTYVIVSCKAVTGGPYGAAGRSCIPLELGCDIWDWCFYA